MKKALVLGRFQPLHNGHVELINYANEKYDTTVVLGSADKAGTSLKHAFTNQERIEMLTRVFGNKIKIMVIDDIPDDDKYVEHVESIVGKHDVIVSGEHDADRKLFEAKGYEVDTIGRIKELQATHVRNLIADDKEWEHHVPLVVANFIKEIDGESRVRNFAEKSETFI